MSENISDTIPDACPGTKSESAGKSSACEGCPNQKFCSSGTSAPPDPAVEQIAKCFENVKHKIIVLSGKGGVGKSSFTVHLSRALALNSDVQVSILDIDICGPSIPHMMGVEDQQIHQSNSGWAPVMVDDNLSVMSVGFMLENLDVAVIWRGPKKNGIIKKFLLEVNWGELSYLVIDTPPGTSDEHLSIVQYLADAKVDGAIVVTTPQEVSLVDVRKEINFCKKTGIPVIGVVENMAGFTCPKCKKSTDIFSPSSGGAKIMAEEMNVPFLGSIPLDPTIGRFCDEGRSIFDAENATDTTNAILNITSKIKEFCNDKSTLIGVGSLDA